MARSLTIKHEEHATTSPLLTGFLVIAAAWLLASALLGSDAEAGISGADAPQVGIHE